MNHFENTRGLTTKTGLVRTLSSYYLASQEAFAADYTVFESVATSFLITSGVENLNYLSFIKRFKELQQQKFERERVPAKHCMKNMWIIKPANEN